MYFLIFLTLSFSVGHAQDAWKDINAGATQWGSTASSTSEAYQQNKLRQKELEDLFEQYGISSDQCPNWSKDKETVSTNITSNCANPMMKAAVTGWKQDASSVAVCKYITVEALVSCWENGSTSGSCSNPTKSWRDVSANNYDGCSNAIKNCTDTTGVTCCDSSSFCKNLSYDVKHLSSSYCNKCDEYQKTKKAGSSLWNALAAIISTASNVVGDLLSPGCKKKCDGYAAGDERNYCLCNSTEKDGKTPCHIEKSICDNLFKQDTSCAGQMKGEGFASMDAAQYQDILQSCICSKANATDSRGGWHPDPNNPGKCTNVPDVNNNNYVDNNNNGNTLAPIGYSGEVASADNNNNADNGAGLQYNSTLSTGSGGKLGSSVPAGLASKDAKDKAKNATNPLDMSGRSSRSNPITGGGANGAFTEGGAMDTASSKEKPKDIASAKSEKGLLDMIHEQYTNFVVADMFSTGMTSVDKNVKKVKKVIKGKKGRV